MVIDDVLVCTAGCDGCRDCGCQAQEERDDDELHTGWCWKAQVVELGTGW